MKGNARFYRTKPEKYLDYEYLHDQLESKTPVSERVSLP